MFDCDIENDLENIFLLFGLYKNILIIHVIPYNYINNFHSQYEYYVKQLQTQPKIQSLVHKH